MAESQSSRKNRLADSGSPYLRQHADNPVDWHPWSPEVFELAEAEDKPVFLSIGYSTCHWCHVMEEESFSDPEIAALMNKAFVCVKVDREERPDVDHLYMTVCQLLTGSGGWPLTVVMTPDRKPFFAGTYFPRGDHYGRPGMLQLIPRIEELWARERESVYTSAGEIAEGIHAFMSPDPAVEPLPDLPERAFHSIREQFDPVHGGFGSAPKFPVFSNLMFLLGYWSRTGEEEALSMVRHTLEAMSRGGIFDQVGYGLHRYSTDERWFSPHFEKMLYDQALAIITCTETFLATGEEKFRQMAEKIICYVLRDLQDTEGCFYSAEDADSEGEEGKFYTWKEEELLEILDDKEMGIVRQVYNVTGEGNFSTETGVPTGRNILYLNADIEDLSNRPDMHGTHIGDTLAGIREKLMQARSVRVRPLRDEKIMTDWNGLMIAALARAAGAFGEGKYAEAAGRALAGIRNNLFDKKGDLLHIRYDDNDTIPAFLDDHAYLLWGLLELHQFTYDTDYLEAALQMASKMVDLFRDRENGGFYLSRGETDPSGLRLKTSFDGPIPSGNSVAAMSLIRLGRLTGSSALEEEGRSTIRAFAAEMAGNPTGFTHMIRALDIAYNGTAEVIVAGAPAEADTTRFIQTLQRSFLPAVNVVLINPDDPDPRIERLIPFSKDIKTLDGRSAAYICRDFACQAPTTDTGEMLNTLCHRKAPGP